MLVFQVCPLTFWPKNWFKFKAKSNHEATYEADCVKGKIQYIRFGQRFYLNSEPRHWVQSYYILFYPQTLFLQSTSLIGPGGIEHIVWTSDAGQTDREKKRTDSNMVGTNYLLLAGWCLVKTSMIHSFASEISTTFSYSNMTILHSAACFLYKFVLEVSASFLKYCFSNRWWSGTKIGIRMHWVHYYINLHYKTLVWR